MKTPLPKFKYHPDPVATGAVIASDLVCDCCKKPRGHIYVGPVYSVEAEEATVCPWCIADGSAHTILEVAFNDEASVGDPASADSDVDEAVIDEISHRTPGFVAWQQEIWLTHCGDAAAYLGTFGRDELKAMGPHAVAAVRDGTGYDDDEWAAFFGTLDKDESPSAYLFRCLKCGAYVGYADSD